MLCASMQVLTRVAGRRRYQTPRWTGPLLVHPHRSGRAEQEGRRTKGLAHEQEEGLEGVMRIERSSPYRGWVGTGSGYQMEFGSTLCACSIFYTHLNSVVLSISLGIGSARARSKVW